MAGGGQRGRHGWAADHRRLLPHGISFQETHPVQAGIGVCAHFPYQDRVKPQAQKVIGRKEGKVQADHQRMLSPTEGCTVHAIAILKWSFSGTRATLVIMGSGVRRDLYTCPEPSKMETLGSVQPRLQGPFSRRLTICNTYILLGT